MEKYRKLIRIISSIELILSGALLFIMVFLSFIEIVQRVLFANSFAWVQEVTIIMFFWMVFTGVAYIYNAVNLLSVNFLYVKVHGTTKFIWDFIVHLLVFAVLIVFFIWGSKFVAIQNLARTNALNLSNSLYSIPFVIMSFSMMMKLVEKYIDFINEYRFYRQRKKEDTR